MKTTPNYTNKVKRRTDSSVPLTWGELDDNLRYSNTWESSSTITYKVGMVVLWNDYISTFYKNGGLSQWICVLEHTNSVGLEPSNGSVHWERMIPGDTLYYSGDTVNISAVLNTSTLKVSDGVNNFFEVNCIKDNTISIGYGAGNDASGSTISNFIGYQAGYNSCYNLQYNDYNNYIGYQAGMISNNSGWSNFIGYQAGYNSISSDTGVFIGYQSGMDTTNVVNSNLIGLGTGQGGENQHSINFIGPYAGYYSSYNIGSTFIGYSAGRSNSGSSESFFVGANAGNSANNSNNSTFIGNGAGHNAVSSPYNNFIGYSAGKYASNSTHSHFIGAYAGSGATNSYYSVFIGDNAGDRAISSSFSTFIGYSVGQFIQNSNHNVIIGSNVSLPDNSTGMLNIGGVLFGSGLNTVTGGNPPTTAISGGKIGVGVVSPTTTLDVNGCVKIGDDGTSQLGSIRFNGGELQVYKSTGWKTIQTN